MGLRQTTTLGGLAAKTQSRVSQSPDLYTDDEDVGRAGSVLEFTWVSSRSIV